MTEATITDINEYRARKVGSAKFAYFSDWTDDMIRTRHKLLGFIENGNTELIDMRQAAVRAVFPDGYDPGSHPGDNIDAVYAEGVRRGVFVTSA